MAGLADIELADGIETGGSEDPFADEVAPDRIQEVRARLKAIIEANPKQLYDAEGKIRPPDEWPEREAMAIQRWSHNQSSDTWNITFHDKNRAADQLARMDGLYKADHEQQHENPFAAILDQIPRSVLRLFMAELKRQRDTVTIDAA